VDSANYFLFSTSPKTCASGSPCITLEGPNGFAWNHGDFQNDITNTWLGIAGPGVRRDGLNGEVFSDHTDIHPTIIRLAGLEDDYDHDGRVLFEVLEERALPQAREHREILTRLAQIYKQINAPRGKLGRETLRLSTKALQGDDATYTAIEDKIAKLTTRRDAIAAKMIEMLEDAAFDRKPIDVEDARELIEQAEELLETAKS
jgi:arylsulfatase A-like enzyme